MVRFYRGMVGRYWCLMLVRDQMQTTISGVKVAHFVHLNIHPDFLKVLQWNNNVTLLLPLLVREDSHYLNKRLMLSFTFREQPCFIIVHFITLHTITSESKFQTEPKRWFWTTRFISFWGNRTNVSRRREGKGQHILFFQPNEWSDLHKVTLIHHRTSFHFFSSFLFTLLALPSCPPRLI